MKNKEKLIKSAILLIVAIITHFTNTVQAQTQYLPYLSYNTEIGQLETLNPPSYTEVTSETTTMGENGKETWYAVTSNVIVSSRMSTKGTVHLIICDGKTLDAQGGIECGTLHIHPQTNGTGKLTAGAGGPGIGGGSCKLFIHGCAITAQGGDWSAGIGGGTNQGGGIIEIYGGSVHATLGNTNGNGDQEAIGHGSSGGAFNRTFADGLCVKVGGNSTPELYENRFKYIDRGHPIIHVVPCTSHTVENGKCKYCGIHSHKVTYICDDATSGNVPIDTKSYSHGSTVTVLGNTGNLARYGYEFKCWNTKRDGSGTDYYAGSTFKIGKPVTLYAKWKKGDPSLWSNIIIDNGIEHGTITCEESALHGSTVTLNVAPEARYSIKSVTYNDGIETHEIHPNDGTYSFTMPATDITVSATFVAGYDYLAYNNDKREFENKKVTGSISEVTSSTTSMGSSGQTTWYAVADNVTIGSRVQVNGTVNLILCNGTTLTVNGGMCVQKGVTLNIYAQNGGSGALVSTNGSYDAGIGGNDGKGGGTINIHGGIITATGQNGTGIGGGYAASNEGSITIYGGTIKAAHNQLGAGIGAGRWGNGGTINIIGGSVTSTGFIAIGNGQDGNPGTLHLEEVRVYDKNDVLVTAEKRVSTCRQNGTIRIVPCTMHEYSNNLCKYCGCPDLSKAKYDNDGCLVISTTEDWNLFAAIVAYDETFFNKTVKLANDISVSTMVGSDYSKFKGTFDGNGHTLTVNYNTTEQYTAPFRYTDGATIKNLKIAGSVESNQKFAASLIGSASGATTITNCVSTASITGKIDGDGTHGGFVAISENNSSVKFSDCAFVGKMFGSTATYNGGFLGYIRSGSTSYTNCLFAPTEITMGTSNSCTFNRNNTPTIDGAYYTTKFGTAQGTPAYTEMQENNLYKKFTICNYNVYVLCDVSGVEDSYDYYGEPITVDYTVEMDGKELPDNSYTTTITDEGNEIISEPINVDGTYTITIVGDENDNYAGSYSKTFSVIDIPYTVHFDKNNDNATGTMDNTTFRYDDKQNLTAVSFSYNSPYMFAGWNTKADGTGTHYANGEEVVNLTNKKGETVTLYAQWKLDDTQPELEGDGTENNPYRITSTETWNAFALMSAYNDFSGKYVMLAADNIEVSTMVGTSNKKFAGTFLGGNNTLKVSLSGGGEGTALFYQINDATIQDVKVEGTIKGNSRPATFASFVSGNCTINNCISSVSITSTRTNNWVDGGAMVGRVNTGATIDISDCAFFGSVIYDNTAYQGGGFVGWTQDNAQANLSNCLYAPSSLTLSKADKDKGTYIFVSGKKRGSLTNCYYNTTANDASVITKEGTLVFETAPADNLTEEITLFGEKYYALCEVSGIQEYYASPDGQVTVEYTVQQSGTTLPADCCMATITDNSGNIVPSITQDGKYTITISGVEANGCFGSWSKSVEVIIADLVITSTADWNSFATRVNNGDKFSGKTVKLISDNVVASTMVGTSSNKFSGTFDGGNNTLTLSISATANIAGPFRYIDGATIRNLTVTGSLTNSGKQKGGIAGYSYGAVKIENVNVAAVISSTFNGDASNGGFIAHIQTGSATFTNCAFTGSLLGTNPSHSSGFVGWRDNENFVITFNNCLFAPVKIEMGVTGSSTFNRRGDGTFNGAYYTQTFGTTQGTQIFAEKPDNKISKKITFFKKDYYNPCVITCDVQDAYDYYGEPISISYSVKYNGTALLDEDYTVQITDGNDNELEQITAPGTYTFTISGVEDKGYTGTYSKTFTVTAITYTVHFDKNTNAEVEGTMEDITFTYDEPQTLPANAFEKGETPFYGWNTLPNGSGLSIADKEEVSNLTTEKNGVVTLYAQWNQMLVLANDNDNTDAINEASADAAQYNVTLADRTLLADGTWNTITLPFDVTIAGSVLDGAEARTLTSSSITDGILNMTFGGEVAELEAGKPYIIKWKSNIEQYDEQNRFIIRNANDWNTFATMVSNGARTLNAVLAKDITGVTKMVQTTESAPYNGTLDGNGHTMTVNISGSGEGTALFYVIGSATIQNLNVEGTITTSKYRPGTFASFVQGNSTIKNCWSNVDIKSTYTSNDWVDAGGFVARVSTNGKLNLTNCIFTGTITYDNNTYEGGGMVGWTQQNSTANLTNCLFMPSALTMSKTNTDTYVFVSGVTRGKFTNCYYNSVAKASVLKNEGTDASAMTNAALIAALGDGWKERNGKVVPAIQSTQIINGDIVSPVFSDVTVKAEPTNITTDNADFIGNTSPVAIEDGESVKMILIGSDEESTETLNSCRGYLNISNEVDHITLDYGDGETSPILYIDEHILRQCTPLPIADITSVSYNGEVQTPVVTIKDGDNVLVAGTDYTVILPENGCKDAGNYTVTVKGKGKYYGTKTGTFTIVGKDDDGNLLISSTEDWNAFAEMVAGGESFSGKTVKLVSSDVVASTMVGTENSNFSGTFDGGKYTLTFNFTTTQDNAAPFQWINNATIKDLTVKGEINAGAMFAAGIAARVHGECTIENCVSGVTINASKNGDGTHGGFVGRIENDVKKITFADCLFNGTFNGVNTDNWCPYAGWTMGGNNTNLIFNNCLFAPTSVNVRNGNATVHRNGTATINGAYYTEPLGTVQGVKVFAEMPDDEITKKITLFEKDYYAKCDVVGIKNSHITYEGEEYIPNFTVLYDGEALSSDNFSIFYTCNGASVSSITTAGEYTITIAAKDDSDCFGKETFNITVRLAADGFEVRYDLVDSYGDGWNGCAINVKEQSSDNEITKLTISDRSKTANGTFSLTPGNIYNFVWVKGSYPYETSWTFYDADGEQFLTGEGSDNLNDGATLIQYYACYKPRNLKAQLTSDNAIQLDWISLANQQDSWDVAYKTNADADFTIIEGVANNPYLLENKQPGYLYTFKVRSRKVVDGKAYTSNWSDEASYHWTKPITHSDIAISIAPATYDGTAQTPTSITVTDGSKTLVLGTDYTVALPGNDCINAGSYDVVISGIGDYNGETTGQFVITPADLTITANPHTITYGDEPSNDGVTYDGFIDGENESVLTGSLDYEYDYNQYDNADGDYTITPKGLSSDNYDINFVPGKLTIEPKEIGIEWSDETEFTYDGNEHSITATATELVNGNECLLTIENNTATEVGNYTAIITGLSNDNYKLPDDNLEHDFEITTTIPEVTALEAIADLVYSGTEQDLITAGSTNFGTLLYSLDGENYSEEIPTGTDAYTYTVYYKVEESDNWEGVEGNIDVTIDPAEISITAENKTKVYGEDDPEFTVIVEGLVNGDDESVLNYSIKRDEGEDVDEYVIYFEEGNNNNYEITFNAGTFKITPAELTVEIYDATKTYGDSDPEFTATTNGIVEQDKEWLESDIIASLIRKDDSEDVGEYEITLDDNYELQNYTLNITPGILTITPATVTVTANAYYKTYGDDDPGFEADVDGADDDEIAYNIYRAEGDNDNVGEHTIFVTGDPEQGNYQVAFVNGTLTIEPKEIGIEWSDETEFEYDGNEHSITATATDLVNGDECELTIVDNTATEVGNYTATVTAVNNDNYKLPDDNLEQNFEITTTIPEVTAPEAIADLVYSGTEQDLITAGSTNFGTLLYSLDGENYSEEIPTGTDAYTYTVYYKVEESDNWEGVEGNIDVTIDPAEISITAENKTKVYGEDDPEFTVIVEGLVNGDDESVLNYSIKRDEDDNDNVGEHTIFVTGDPEQGNYQVAFVNGTLTIEPKEIGIEWNEPTEFAYDGTEQSISATATDLINDDQCNLTLENYSATNVGTYTAKVTGLSNNNYTLPSSGLEQEWKITARAISITANNATKIYGDPDPTELTAVVVGLIGTDKIEYTVTREEGDNVGNYTITPTITNPGNYDVSDVNTGTFTINPKTIGIEWSTPTDFEYDGEEHSITATATGIIDGDECLLTIENNSATEVGNYTASVTALSNDNYQLPNDGYEQDFEITSKDITVTAQNATKAYGDPDPEFTVAISGLPSDATIDYNIQCIHDEKTGTYDIVVTGDAVQGNYNVTFVNGTLTITDKVIETTAMKIIKNQDGTKAILDGEFTQAEAFSIDEDITVDAVEFNRTFTTAVTSTVMLPFEIKEGSYEGGTFYDFTSVAPNEEGIWVATLTKVAGDVQAHTPYLFVPNASKLTIKGCVTIRATSADETERKVTVGDWTFKGLYQRKRWGGDNEIRTDYCFAANDPDNGIAAGEFVRIGKYIQILPFRCYLSYTGNDTRLSKSATELPTNIIVRLIDETATVIEPINEPTIEPVVEPTTEPVVEPTDEDITTPVSETVTSNVKVWSYDKTIYIEGAAGSEYRIIDLGGRLLLKAKADSNREEVMLNHRPTTGIVIVVIGKQSYKVTY